MQLNYPMRSNGLYVLHNSDFDDIATNVLHEYSPQSLERPMPLNVDYFAEECLFLTIIHRFLSYNASILGCVAFADTEIVCLSNSLNPEKLEVQEGTMIIDTSLITREARPRERYTKAHECSHWILHRTYHSPDNRTYDFRTAAKQSLIACRSEAVERFGKSKKRTDNDWEEWQADKLAAALLMPRDIFADKAKSVMRHNEINCGYLVKGEHVAQSIQTVEDLAEAFYVSKKAVQIRLRELGMLFLSRKEVYSEIYS